MARPPAGLFFVPGAARAAGCRYHDGMEAALQSLAAKITQAAARGRPLRIRGGGTKDFYGQQLLGELLDARPLADLLRDDAAPYPWLRSTLTSVMPAHVIYPEVDTRPAGFSSQWLQGILRGRLGFGGAIFSDDLSMEGARSMDGCTLSYTEAAVTALQAGCDLVLLCNQSLGKGLEVDALLDGLEQARAQGQWQPSGQSEARRQALLPRTAPWAWKDLVRSPVYQQARKLLPQGTL